MTVTAAKTKPDPELTAHIQVPDTQNPRAISDRWARTNALLIDLGRFMERTGISFEVTQVDSTVLECVCPDHATFTALRLAYGPFFIYWPQDKEEDDPAQWRKNFMKQAMGQSAPPKKAQSQTWTLADEHARRPKKAQMGTIEAIKQARESAQQSAEEANRAEVKRILASIAQGRSKGTGLSHDQFQHLRRIAGSGASSSLLSAAIKRFISK